MCIKSHGWSVCVCVLNKCSFALVCACAPAHFVTILENFDYRDDAVNYFTIYCHQKHFNTFSSNSVGCFRR